MDVRTRAKTFGKYLFVVIAGCAIGAVLSGLDADGRLVQLRHFYSSSAPDVNGSSSIRSRFLFALSSKPAALLRRLQHDSQVMFKVRTLKPVRVEVERGVSLLLDPADLIGSEILITGVWQPQVWKAIAEGLPAGGVLLDVGAHIGYDSLKGSVTVGPGGRVISFEPNPRTLQQLRANILASHAENVTVEPIACTDKEEMLTLYDSTSEGNSGASSLSLANADETGRGELPSYSVRGRPIDNVIHDLGLNRVDVMKVDVEGAEALVLRGTKETLLRFHPMVIAEVVPDQLAHMYSSAGDLLALMQELGYGPAIQVDEMDWEWKYHVPTKNPAETHSPTAQARR